MSYTYSTLLTALQTAAVQLNSDVNWQNILPTIIDQAEQRIYRDLDLISTVVRDTGNSLTANSRNFTLPQTYGYFITLKGLNIVISGARRQLRPVSYHFIDATWPSENAATTPSIPEYFAPITDQLFIVGPAPDQAYGMEAVGTTRPTPLSSSNTTDFLSLYLSDLLFAGAMAATAGYMRNYGEQADDPKMAVSWEQQYAQRLNSANKEEMRRKFQSGDWTSETRPNPVAT